MTASRFLFALIDGGGNVPPELHAARRLIERGHAVTVIADDSVAADVRAIGANARRWVRAPNRRDRRPENDPIRDWECKHPLQLVDRLMETLLIGPAARYADDVSFAMTEGRPAAVVCSMFCLGGMVVAEAARIPFVVLFPNVYPLPARGLPPFGIGLRPARGRLGRLRDAVLNRLIEWPRRVPGFSCTSTDHLEAPAPGAAERALGYTVGPIEKMGRCGTCLRPRRNSGRCYSTS